jgi:hypothetical protein
MGNWLKSIKDNLLIKSAQYKFEDYAQDSSDSEDISDPSVPSVSSGDIPEEIQHLVQEYISLLKKEDTQSANVVLFTLKQKASKLRIDNDEIDNYISETWLKSSIENFPSSSEVDKEEDAYSNQGYRPDIPADDIVSFTNTLDKLNQYIKSHLREELFARMIDSSLIRYDKGDACPSAGNPDSPKATKGIYSKEKNTDRKKFDFYQWVENSVINSDMPIFLSQGVGVSRKRDDVARFFSSNPQYLPKEYYLISKRSDATKIRSSYNRVVGDEQDRGPLFYHLMKTLVNLVDEKNSDIIDFCVNCIRLLHNEVHCGQEFKERGESQAPGEDMGDLGSLSGSTLSEEDRDSILDWRMKHREEESSLEDEEIMDKIRQETIKDSDTKHIVDNLPGFYNGILNAKSKISVIRDSLVDGVNARSQESRAQRGKRINTDMYVAAINAMLDRYEMSLNDIAQRVRKSVEEGLSPLDIGLQIDMLNDNLVSFNYDGSEVSLDPLNESGSFDFKSSIPFSQTIEQFRTSSDVGQERDSLMSGIESGNISSINKLVDLLVNDYKFAKQFVSGMKKADDNYREDKPQYGVPLDVYELEMALRNTFYNYKLDQNGEVVQKRGGVHPRYVISISSSKFEDTKDDRRKILNQYLLSGNGEGIKNISTLQNSAKLSTIGSKRTRSYNKERFLRSGTRNLALDAMEELSNRFSEDSLAKSILASVLTGLRADQIMCKLLGMSGIKGSGQRGAGAPRLESYDDFISNADEEQRRIADLYVNLFDLKNVESVNINELKIHCLKNKYSFLPPSLRFALVSHAIESNTLDDALRENTSAGKARAKHLVSHALNKRSFTVREIYLRKLSIVKRNLNLLKI